MSGSEGESGRMPWQPATDPAADVTPADSAEEQASPEPAAAQGAVEPPAEQLPVDAGETTAPAVAADAPPRAGDLPWSTAADAAANTVAERTGLDIDGAAIDETARALVTEDGRATQLRELGVHMSGRLAERYGVEDAEAQKLLDASRELSTPAGRQRVLAESAPGATSEILNYLNGRGGSITERRDAVQKLLAQETVRGRIAKAGRGILIVGIILLVVLVGVLIGAVALFSTIVGGADASAMTDTLATRPAWVGIGAALAGRVM